MKLYSINTGHFMLDGGAMYGVVPKSLWSKAHPADEKNMCSWALRCLLIETGNRLILIDNGLGDKQDEKFFGYYHLHGKDTLEKSLAAHGFSRHDITDNILTHLHFDHCGGGIRWNGDRTGFEATFPNATYHVSRGQWETALKPNAREKASFLHENILPMQELGQLKFLDDNSEEFLPGIHLHFVNGHTDSMVLPEIDYQGRKLIYMADLLPSHHHIPMPWVMAYDVRPLQTMEEKDKFLSKAASEDTVFFFEHDPSVECCTVEQTERGVRVSETFALSEV